MAAARGAPAQEGAEATPTPSAAGESAATPESSVDEHRARPETTPTGEERIGGFYLRAYWSEGINYRVVQAVHVGMGETVLFDRDASMTGRIGVKFAVDTAGYVQSGKLPPIGDGIEIRRLFFYTSGEFRFLHPILFKLDVGVVRGSFYVDENYLMLTDLPYVGSFKIGQFDAPMSLELLTGSTARTFMEVSAPVAALAPGLKAGIQIANHALERRLTWAFGYFLDGQDPDVGDASQSFARLIGRVTYLPLVAEKPDDLQIHVGGSLSYVLSSKAEIRYKSRPESFLAPELVDTGVLDAEDAFPIGAEFALTRGPLLVQAEYLASFVTSAEFGDPVFRGYDGLAAWMLTGETHSYDRLTGVFRPMIPARPLAPCQGGWGAWEVAGRYSSLDLSEGTVRGGEMRILSGGVNWYWNRYVRWMLEYGHAFLDRGPNDGQLNVFQVRFQLVF